MIVPVIVLLVIAVAVARITKQGTNNKNNEEQGCTTVARLVTTITNDYI